MIRGAESLTDRLADARRERTPPPPARAAQLARALPKVAAPAAERARDQLILRLAGDRLRELRDDGVTFGYIARIYGVETEEITRLHDELIRPRGI
jgi:hypothetical protein